MDIINDVLSLRLYVIYSINSKVNDAFVKILPFTFYLVLIWQRHIRFELSRMVI